MFSRKTILKISGITLSILISLSAKKSFTETDFENYTIQAYSTQEYFNGDRSNLNTKQLEKMRDDCVKQAYDFLIERVGYKIQEYDEFYDEYTKSSFSPHNFFIKKYKGRPYDEILEKEIVFLDHLNSTYETIDTSQGYMPCAFSTYESFLFEKNHGRKMISTKDMDTNGYKEMFEFYADNFQYMPYEMDSDVDQIFYTIYPRAIERLGPDLENEIQNKLKNKATKIKKYIKSLKMHIDDRDQKLIDLCDKIEDASLSNDGDIIEKDEYIPSNMERASIRSKVLQYAREQGYTNGYNGANDEKNRK